MFFRDLPRLPGEDAGIGSAVAGGTAGSVLFVDSSGDLGQDNGNFFWDATNKRLGLGINTSLTAIIHIVKDNIGTANTEGIALENNTPAVLNGQQFSPAIRWKSAGWSTTTSASVNIEYLLQLQPVQAALANQQSYLAMYSRTSVSPTWATVFQIRPNITGSTSAFVYNGNFVPLQIQTATIRGSFTVLGETTTVSSSDNWKMINLTAATVGTQQWSPTLQWEGKGWETTGGTSVAVSGGVQMRTVSGTTAPTGYFAFMFGFAGAAYATPVLTLHSGGQILATVGSQPAPTYSFTDSPGTGMYYPGAHTLRLTTAGNSRLFFGNSVSMSALGAGSANVSAFQFATFSVQTAGRLWTVESPAATIRMRLNNDGRPFFQCIATAPDDADIMTSGVTWWVDESGNNLTFRVKYADGTTLKSGTVALT